MEHEPGWAPAIRALATRVAGVGEDAIEISEFGGPLRAYRFEGSGGRLRLAATGPGAAAVGLRHAIRNATGGDLQWQQRLPRDVAFPGEGTGAARVHEQYMFNFCTYSYTMPFWDWEPWQAEIDWMAVHGITMPLALVGHEAVLAEAFTRAGVGRHEVLAFIGGPSYLPFQFMGCREGDRPIVTDAWLAERRDLGRRILDRERELGMRPVLPAFTGHVPSSFAPGATRTREWQDNRTAFLDPAHPAFAELAATIVTVQQEWFGTDGLYASDPFIETPPLDETPDHTAQVAAAIVDGLTRADPAARWVMQAWPFAYQASFWSPERVASFLGAIDDERMIVLDLWAEQAPVWPKANGYGSKEWLWCGLLNFGGRSDAVAELPAALDRLETALSSPHPPNGIGLAMEASRNNSAFFELLCDSAWAQVDDLGAWVEDFARRRYGRSDRFVADAWRGLLATVLDTRGRRIFPEDPHGLLTRRPSLELALNPDSLRERVGALQWFEPPVLVDAWEGLVRALEHDPQASTDALGFDVVEVGQAVLVRAVDLLLLAIAEAPDRPARRHAADRLDAAFAHLDALASARPETRLDDWEEQAVRAAAHGLDADRVLREARQILTTWNERPGTELDDYAGRMWHGLVAGYYARRWRAWVAAIDDPALARGLDATLDAIAAEFLAAGAPGTAPADLPAAARAAVEYVRPVLAPTDSGSTR